MPVLVSPEKAGTMSADALANLENELAGEAAKLNIAVGSVNSGRAKSADQRAFDAGLSNGVDPFGGRLTQADVAYLQKMGVSLERIQRAARGSGVAMPAEPIDQVTHDLHREAGIAQPDATPSDYNFDIGRLSIDLPAERQAVVHSTLAQWSSELRLDPTMAKGVGEYIAEEGPRLAKMSDGERAHWLDQQNSAIHKAVNGNKAMAADMFAKAHKVLGMSGAINGTERFSDAIKNGVIGKSAWLIRTLANHADALERAERAKKKL